jgi:hypothetical protein
MVKTPQSADQHHRPVYLDRGTHATPASGIPGHGFDPRVKLEDALHDLDMGAFSIAIRVIPDAAHRLKYLAEIKKYSDIILEYVKQKPIYAREGARAAHEMRDELLKATRLNLTMLGRKLSENEKQVGKTFEEFLNHYAKKLFNGQTFAELKTAAEQNRVYGEMIEAAGRGSKKWYWQPKWLLRGQKLAKGLVFMTWAFTVYHVATAKNKLETALRDGANLAGGVAGSEAGGAAGLWCGPAAPVCVPVLAFVGGALGAMGMDHLFDWLKSEPLRGPVNPFIYVPPPAPPSI